MHHTTCCICWICQWFGVHDSDFWQGSQSGLLCAAGPQPQKPQKCGAESNDWRWLSAGVSLSASVEDIRKAFLQRAKSAHPDVVGSGGKWYSFVQSLPSWVEELTAKFRDVSAGCLSLSLSFLPDSQEMETWCSWTCVALLASTCCCSNARQGLPGLFLQAMKR